jgi:hypothetical protein
MTIEYPGVLPEGWDIRRETQGDEPYFVACSTGAKVYIWRDLVTPEPIQWEFNKQYWRALVCIVEWCQCMLAEHRRTGEVEYDRGRYTQACSCGGRWEQWYRLNCYHLTANGKRIDVEEAQ